MQGMYRSRKAKAIALDKKKKRDAVRVPAEFNRSDCAHRSSRVRCFVRPLLFKKHNASVPRSVGTTYCASELGRLNASGIFLLGGERSGLTESSG